MPRTVRMAPSAAGQQPSMPWAPGRKTQYGRLDRRGIKLLVGLTLSGAALFGALSWGQHVLRATLASSLQTTLGHPVQIGEIDIRPWSASAWAHDLRLERHPGDPPILEITSLSLSLDVWASIRHAAPVLDQLTLVTPQVHIVRTGARTLDISPLLERLSAPRNDQSGRGWRIHRLHIKDGSLTLVDPVVGRTTRFDAFTMTLRSLSTLAVDGAQPAEMHLVMRLNAHPVAITARLAPFAHPPTLKVQGTVSDLPLTDWTPYLGLPADFTIQEGNLSAKLSGEWRGADAPQAAAHLTLSGDLTLDRGRLVDRHGQPRVSWDGATLAMEPSPIMPVPMLHIRDITMTAPRLVLNRQAQGTLEWPPLGTQAPQQKTTRSATPLGLRIDRIELRDGAISWHNARPDAPESVHLEHIQIETKNIALRDLQAAPHGLVGHARIEAVLDQTSPLQGTVTMHLQQSQAALKAQRLDLKRWVRWAAPGLQLQCDQGQLSLQAHLNWQPDSGIWTLHHGQAQLENLALSQTGTRQVWVRLAHLRDATIDSQARSIEIGGLHLEGAEIATNRDEQGRFNVADWYQASNAPPTQPTAPAWSLKVLTAQADAVDLDYHDRLKAPNHPWPRIRFWASAESWAPGLSAPMPFTLRAALADGSRVSLAGRIRHAPLNLQADLNLHSLALQPFTPYLDPYVNVVLHTGTLWGSGRLILTSAADGTLQHLGFQGGLSLNDFSAFDHGEDPLLRWAALAAPSMKIDWFFTPSNPSQVDIGELAFVDFYSRLIISPEGRLNVADLLARPDQASEVPSPSPRPATASETAPPAIRVGTLRLARGQVAFTDRFIRPSYSAYLSELQGTIEAGSSEPDQASSILITGHVDGDTPLEITGTIQPFVRPGHMDIRAMAHGFDLPKINAYAKRWAGYTIEKGKLSADVRYAIQGDRLSAQNRLTINQMTFGEKVESPDATALPMRLAVALLKDRDGNIDLDLPISGTINDPQFSVGSLIGQALRNLIIRTVTAPFTLLSTLTGETPDNTLNHIEFSPGTSELDARARDRLDRLAHALAERPTLSMELIGHADPNTDRGALTEARITRSHSKNTEKKPHRESTPAYTLIADEELKTLAQQRANVARDYLRTTHGLNTDRLWLLAPRLTNPNDPTPARRAEFRLQ
jgi:outer membrane protein OmpA-like peptidoglycan-associated protein